MRSTRPGQLGDRTGLHQIEADGALSYVLLVDQALLHKHVEDAVCQCGVGPGHELEVEVGSLRRKGGSWVCNNQVSAGRLASVKILHYGGHGLGRVAPNEENRLCAGYVLDGEGETPVHAKGSDGRRGCR